ncbi:MAG: TIGR03936 family radical SAM-associated protein [Bacillota bacterium]
MRIRARLEKAGPARYISHLDFLRALERALRRARLPIAYSEGFNPHPRLSFASALPLGATSEAEFIDLLLREDLSATELQHRLNAQLPEGIRVAECREVDEAADSLAARLERCTWEVTFLPQVEPAQLQLALDELSHQRQWIVIKETKKGRRELDIRQLVYGIELDGRSGSGPVLRLQLACGSKDNVRPEHFVELLGSFGRGCPGLAQRVRHIHRQAIWCRDAGGRLTDAWSV